MSYKTKTITVRLNWKHLEALDKLTERWELASRNKIITNCLMWRASETVQEFEALEDAYRAQNTKIDRLESVIRMLLWDNWTYFIRDNKDILGFWAKPNHTYEDYFYNTVEKFKLGYFSMHEKAPSRTKDGKYRGFN